MPAPYNETFSGPLPAYWYLDAPVGGSVAVDAGELVFTAPAAEANLYTGVFTAPRLLQPCPDTDLDISLKVVTMPPDATAGAGAHGVGLIVQADTGYHRFDFYGTNGPTSRSRFAAWVPLVGAASNFGAGSYNVAGPQWLRFTRSGNTWAFYTSADGSAWSIRGSRVQACTVTAVGIVFPKSATTGPPSLRVDDFITGNAPPAGGTAHTVDIADAAGAYSGTGPLAGYARTVAELAAAHTALAASGGNGREHAEQAGASDALSRAAAYLRDASSGAAATDTAAAVYAAARAIAEAAGAADAAGAAAAYLRAAAEQAGATDALYGTIHAAGSGGPAVPLLLSRAGHYTRGNR